jgi:hypothetical protein
MPQSQQKAATACRSPWVPGFCQTTAFHTKGDCTTDTVGFIDDAKSAEECVQRCKGCGNCATVSFSRMYKSCDWFSHCPRVRPPLINGRQTDHCTITVRPPTKGLMSMCLHAGFANQLYSLLAAAHMASTAQLTLLLRPILHPYQKEYDFSADGPCDNPTNYDVSDWMDQCTGPGWSGASTVLWEHVLDRWKLPCRTVATDQRALFAARTLRLGYFGGVCNSRFTTRNTTKTLWAGCGDAIQQRIPHQALHLDCMSQLAEQGGGGPHQHYAFGTFFDMIRPWIPLHDGTHFVAHLKFSPAVRDLAARLVREMKEHSPEGFWCAHVRVGRSMENGHVGGFHDGLYTKFTAPTIRRWARNAGPLGLLMTDNHKHLMRDQPSLCANRTCVHDSRLAELSGCPMRPPSATEPCQVVHLAAACLACAHATRLFFSGGSTFSRLVLDLHLHSPMVERDVAFQRANRLIYIGGNPGMLPFGGVDELRRIVKNQGARLRFQNDRAVV